ncbi:MAG: class I SAM-dependent methyltransferase [Candidatus Krumholzibacteriota bacterium]|nr:class I SAM-dependent methyltransferase [Candidatus Krumholzibacteriota bacterium]
MDSEYQKSKVKEYFDEDSRRYEEVRYTEDYSNCHQYSYLARMAHVLELLEDDGKKILDIGCGPGIYTRQLLDRGYNITSIDIAPGMIEKASKKFSDEIGEKRVTFTTGEIYDLNDMEGYFDAVLCIGVVSYIPKIREFLDKIYSLTRPGGYAVIQISKKYSPKSFDEQLVYPSIQKIKGVIRPGSRSDDTGVILTRYRTAVFDRLCRESGLLMEKGAHFDYNLPVINILAKKFSLSLARSLERRRSRIFQALLAGDRVARYRKREK